jgi:hypothetical protein
LGLLELVWLPPPGIADLWVAFTALIGVTATSMLVDKKDKLAELKQAASA